MDKQLLCETADGHLQVIKVTDNKIECFRALTDVARRKSNIKPNQYVLGDKVGEMTILIMDNEIIPKRKFGFLRGQNKANLILDVQSGKHTLTELSEEYNVYELKLLI